ncbi:MAG: hypothetical protein QNK54_06910 [Candidatus Planktophila sp.]|jgi:DNA-binding NarL/FixJ family response regulator
MDRIPHGKSRDLTPFEMLVIGLLCEGKSNVAIGNLTGHTEKVIENTISRSTKAFGVKSDADTNIRVLVALAFRSHYGDLAFNHLNIICAHQEIEGQDKIICYKLVH